MPMITDVLNKDLMQKRIGELQSSFLDDCSSGSLRLLLYGQKGTGKTTTCLTAKKPIWIDQFDPGGAQLPKAKEMVEKGELIVNSEWSKKDPRDPNVIRNWLKYMTDLEKEGLFKQIGTYVLDSITFFADYVLYETINDDPKNTTRKTDVPSVQIQNYNTYQGRLVHIMRGFIGLPCHIIVTGHAGMVKDDLTGRTHTQLNLIGEKTPYKVAAAFPEYWCCRSRVVGQKVLYELLTAPDGLYDAKTVMGSGVYQNVEEPNVSKLLEKIGASIDTGVRFK